MNGLFLLPASLMALLLMAIPVSANTNATEEDQARLLADDLRFAEALAVNRFFDLAHEVVAATVRSIDALRGDEVELAGDASLVKARIGIRLSESTADATARLAAMSASIDELRDWSKPGSAFAYLDRMTDALEDLAKALGQRGKEYALQSVADGNAAAAASADQDFKEADSVFQELRKEALKRADQLEGEEKNDAAVAMRAKAALTYYLRGLNAVDWADVASDRDFRLEQAIELIDEFQWEVDDAALVYFSSSYEMARAFAKLGELGEARALLENLLELGLPQFWEDKENDVVIITEYSPGLQQIIGGLFDSVWGYLALLDADDDKFAAGQARIDAMLAEHADKQVPMRREGHDVLLTWAQKLSDLGKNDAASKLALLVAKEGRGTPAGGRAESFLSNLVTSGSVVIDAPDALMSAAKGFTVDKNFGQAAFFYERAASLAVTPEDQATFAFDAWMGAGRSLRNLSRHLEAGVAFEQALEAAIKLFPDDIQKQENSAERMYQSYASRYAETQVPFDKALRDAASQRILDLGLVLDVQFAKALEAFRDLVPDDTQGALAVLAEFEAVPESSVNFERAMVYAARCLRAAGRTDDALARFTQMEERAADPRLEPTNDGQRNKREIALAEARYFHAEVLLDDEVRRYEDALALLVGFEEDAPKQDSFHPRVKWQRVVAHAKAGHFDEAEEALDILREYPGVRATFISSAAFRVATALKAESVRLKEAGDTEAARDFVHRAAQALEFYAEADGYSSYRNLLTLGEWYRSADQPGDALRAFEKALEVHSDNPDLSTSNLDAARIGKARALDEQHDFAQSRPVWMDLLNRNARVVSIRRGAARSLGGWLELGANGQVVEIAGAGDYALAHDLWVDLFKGTKGESRYTQLYWESKLGSIDTWYRQRAADPERGRQARTVLEQLILFSPNYDEDTIDGIDPSLRYSPLYAPLFKYLEKHLPSN